MTTSSYSTNSSNKRDEIVRFINFSLKESKEVKSARVSRNKENVDAYFGRSDPRKGEHQSRVFVPKTFVAVERLSKFITKAITDAGNEFFSVETGKVDLDPEIARALLNAYLHRIGPSGESFLQVVEKCVKLGLLKGEMVAKVTGYLVEETVRFPTDTRKVKYFKPVVEGIDPDDFFIDPTGRGLYEAQKFETDFYSIKALADAGVYDKEEVKDLEGKGSREFRRSLEMVEFYGKFLDSEGKVIANNGIAVLANGDCLLRLDEAPFWHGGSQFVYRRITGPIKENELVAIMDGPVALNRYMNELMNLILDSSIRATIGVNLVRTAFLEDPRDVIGGIAPGSKIRVSANAPVGSSPIENIQLGQINPMSLQTYGVLESLFIDSSVLTDIAIGRAPPKEATATEILHLTQSQSVLLAGFIISVENFISEILRKLWLILMQNLEFLRTDDILSAIGADASAALARMGLEDRYDTFSGIGFTVKGISDLLRKAQDIQRYTQFLGVAFSNEPLAKAFLSRIDLFKYLQKLATLYGIDISAVAMPIEAQMQMDAAISSAAIPQAINTGEAQNVKTASRKVG